MANKVAGKVPVYIYSTDGSRIKAGYMTVWEGNDLTNALKSCTGGVKAMLGEFVPAKADTEQEEE